MRSLAWLATALILVSCSGGGTESDNSDDVPPAISVAGETEITVQFGTEYEDAGASASDNRDGDVPVSTSGVVDTQTAGTYQITYSATDSSGNTAQATRTVIVSPQMFWLTMSAFGEASFPATTSETWECRDDGRLCRQRVEAGSVVSIDAIPDAGHRFESWLGCDSVMSSTCSIEIDSDRTVYATVLSEEPIEFQDNVVLLSDTQIASISTAGSSENVLVFSAGADLSNVSIGSIIVSKGTADGDLIFGKRVLDIIELPGASTLVEVADVGLGEVIKKGTIVAYVDQSQLERSASQLEPGVKYTASAGDGDKNDPVEITISLEEVLKYNDGAPSPISLNGEVTLSFISQFLIEFDDISFWPFDIELRPSYMRYYGNANINGQFGPKLTAKLLDYKEVYLFPAGTITLPPVPGVPIPITQEVEPVLEVRANAEGSMQVAVKPESKLIASLEYTRGHGWNNLSSTYLGGSLEFPETVTAQARFDVGPGFRYKVKPFGIAGPFLQGTLYGGAEVAIKPQDTSGCDVFAKAFAGARASAGGDFSVLGWGKDFLFPDSLSWELTLLENECQAPKPDPVESINISQISASSLKLSWDDVASEYPVAYFEVYRKAADEPFYVRLGQTGSRDFKDNGVSVDVRYCYFVRAVSVNGESSDDPNSPTCFVTFDSYDTSPPASVIINDIFANSTSSITLSWQAASEADVTNYNVYDVSAGDAQAFVVSTTPAETETIIRLNPDTEYCYRVSAVDGGGNVSPISDVRCVRTLPIQQADWKFFIACQGREWLIEEQVDLNEFASSTIEVAGIGNDYDGSDLTYLLQGLYDADSSVLDAQIYWTFADTGNERIDKLVADLSTGDSGVVPMDLILDNGGCLTQIRVVKSDIADSESTTASVRLTKANTTGVLTESLD